MNYNFLEAAKNAVKVFANEYDETQPMVQEFIKECDSWEQRTELLESDPFELRAEYMKTCGDVILFKMLHILLTMGYHKEVRESLLYRGVNISHLTNDKLNEFITNYMLDSISKRKEHYQEIINQR